uniref:Uncharacterized protein n=1 Tax=Anopheles melas TaxID=34690 RepID=A0A182TQX0_9DIPT
MAPQKAKPQQEQQVALLNDNLFTCVLTAGTNVKKYTRLVEKNEHQFDLMEVSVRQFEVECRPGKDGRPKVPITLDELLTMDIDMHMEAGSEKDVIDALLASQQSTTVQNVDDITLRELPPSLRHDEEYHTVDNDFGEARSNELLDFFNNSAQEPETEPASMIHTDLPVTQDDLMDIDPSLEPELDAVDSIRFLTRFTGNPAEWEYLKRTEDPHSEKRKDKKDEGVVTSHALQVVLRSLFDEVGDESIPFEMIQAKMGSRQIAASLFAKLLAIV